MVVNSSGLDVCRVGLGVCQVACALAAGDMKARNRYAGDMPFASTSGPPLPTSPAGRPARLQVRRLPGAVWDRPRGAQPALRPGHAARLRAAAQVGKQGRAERQPGSSPAPHSDQPHAVAVQLATQLGLPRAATRCIPARLLTPSCTLVTHLPTGAWCSSRQPARQRQAAAAA